jgi:hypothetical protein
MWAPVFVAMLSVHAPQAGSSLSSGIRCYEAGDHACALSSLTTALRETTNRRELARVHLYIGLIQFQYKQASDARASFGLALDLDPTVSPPKSAPSAARKLFQRVASSKKPKPIPRDPPRRHAKEREEPPEEAPAPAVESATVAAVLEPRPEIATAPSAIRDVPRARPTPGEDPRPGVERIESPDTPLAPWISLVLGGATAAAGATFIGLSIADANAAPNESLATRSMAIYDRAVTERIIGFSLLGGGLVAVAIAVILFVTE